MEGLLEGDQELEAGTVIGQLDAKNNQFASHKDLQKEESSKLSGQDDKEIAELRKAISEETIDLRGGLGQKFAATLKFDTKMNEAYKNLKGAGCAQKKRYFRIEWAKARLLTKVTISMTKAEEVEEMHGEQGRYMAFDKLAIEEGGSRTPRGSPDPQLQQSMPSGRPPICGLVPDKAKHRVPLLHQDEKQHVQKAVDTCPS